MILQILVLFLREGNNNCCNNTTEIVWMSWPKKVILPLSRSFSPLNVFSPYHTICVCNMLATSFSLCDFLWLNREREKSLTPHYFIFSSSWYLWLFCWWCWWFWFWWRQRRESTLGNPCDKVDCHLSPFLLASFHSLVSIIREYGILEYISNKFMFDNKHEV